MLFCLEQIPTEGGENSLVDSFNVAQQLKKEDPHAYDLLTNTHVLFRTKGADILGDYDFEGARPILEYAHLQSIFIMKNLVVYTVVANWFKRYPARDDIIFD